MARFFGCVLIADSFILYDPLKSYCVVVLYKKLHNAARKRQVITVASHCFNTCSIHIQTRTCLSSQINQSRYCYPTTASLHVQ